MTFYHSNASIKQPLTKNTTTYKEL